MPRMWCLSCQYETTLTAREAEHGMTCPECHGGRLVRKRKERPENRVTTLRANTVRSLVAGAVCALAGPPLLMVSLANLSGKAGYVWARGVAGGILLLITAVVFLLVGVVGLIRDLR